MRKLLLVLCLLWGGEAHAQLTSSLISYWKMDEASGNALDAHGTNELTDNSTVAAGTGIINGARDFEEGALGEYFSRASEASLQTGDIDFTFSCWVKLESKANNGFIISKDNTAPAGSREYSLLYGFTADRFQFNVFTATDSAKTAVANNLGSPSTGTWYFIVAWHDATANTVNIQVNNGTVDSTATTGALQAASGAEFEMGWVAFGNTINLYDGLIDEVGFWKRVLTADERTQLYNSGAGLSYGNFTAASSSGVLGGGVCRGGIC